MLSHGRHCLWLCILLCQNDVLKHILILQPVPCTSLRVSGFFKQYLTLYVDVRHHMLTYDIICWRTTSYVDVQHDVDIICWRTISYMILHINIAYDIIYDIVCYMFTWNLSHVHMEPFSRSHGTFLHSDRPVRYRTIYRMKHTISYVDVRYRIRYYILISHTISHTT